jgi:hypothetical protein
MAKRNGTKLQTIVHKTLQGKRDWTKRTPLKTSVKSGSPEG